MHRWRMFWLLTIALGQHKRTPAVKIAPWHGMGFRGHNLLMTSFISIKPNLMDENSLFLFIALLLMM